MSLSGRWRIVETELWDCDVLDLVGSAFIEFGGDESGSFGFIAVQGWMDCREAPREGRPGVEFSWEGNDECDPASGRGWAVLEADGSLRGRIFSTLATIRASRRYARSSHSPVRVPAQRRTEVMVAKAIRGPVDPVEREIEAVLHPGRFIGDPAC
jgi:hypothetical protein